jgi:uncharacterized protein (DUF2336 family)
MLPENFISDLEKAITSRSADTGTMLHQITDLFISNAPTYSTEQLDVYDDVLQKLIARVDVAARAALAKRIAAIENAPASTIKTLASDNAIEVAEPVLSQSPVLTDDMLTECIASRGQEYLLAIATRNTLSENVSGHLIVKGDRKVLARLSITRAPRFQSQASGFLSIAASMMTGSQSASPSELIFPRNTFVSLFRGPRRLSASGWSRAVHNGKS